MQRRAGGTEADHQERDGVRRRRRAVQPPSVSSTSGTRPVSAHIYVMKHLKFNAHICQHRRRRRREQIQAPPTRTATSNDALLTASVRTASRGRCSLHQLQLRPQRSLLSLLSERPSQDANSQRGCVFLCLFSRSNTVLLVLNSGSVTVQRCHERQDLNPVCV